jgi:hypothetical protein
LEAAVRSLASSERPLESRLQVAWDDHVQMLWMQPCLTIELLREFTDFWHRYTAQSDDRRSTKLRELTYEDSVRAVNQLVAMTIRTAVVAASAPVHQKLATLADLT